MTVVVPKEPHYYYDSLSFDNSLYRFILCIDAIINVLAAVSIWFTFCIKDVHEINTTTTTTTTTTDSCLLDNTAASDTGIGHASLLLHNNNKSQGDDAEQGMISNTNNNKRKYTQLKKCPNHNNIHNGNDDNDNNSTRSIHDIILYYFKVLAEMHTSMWSRKADAWNNHAASMLMGWLVLTFGIIRFSAVLVHEYTALAAISYAIEGLLFLTEAVKSTMDPKRGTLASIFNFILLLVSVMNLR